ncbi:MAG: glycosyltransferase family 2 protein [Lachnospiraceae bacterium]|nr:glycosyltransferase family 2 protein [Lachnospiraceae bacterium]
MNDFDTVNMNKLQKARYYLREYGWEYTKNRALKKLGIKVPEESEYKNWLRKRMAGPSDLEAQKEKTFPFYPTIDVVIDETPGLLAGSDAVSMTLEGNAKELLRTIKKQSYPAIGAIRELQKDEGTSVEAELKKCKGEVIVFAQADTMLSPDLFFEYVKAFNEHPEVQMIYTDEDCGTADGKTRFRPYFKPDIAPELLTSFQYIGPVFAVKKELCLRIMEEEELPEDLEILGNGWYEGVLLLTEYLTAQEPKIQAPDDIGSVHPRSIYHIAKPLVTRVTRKDFTGFYRLLSAEQGDYIKKHLDRAGQQGIVEMSDAAGFFHVRYALPDPKPLVSVLIPNKDHVEDLSRCIQSFLQTNDYPAYELIIVENNSTDPETFAWYEKTFGAAYEAGKPVEGKVTDREGHAHRVVVVTYQGGFQFSAINNLGAKYAKGELLLLLNNDTEIRTGQTIGELVSGALLPGFGGSGAMLYYDDGTIQHGGVIYKIGGFAANALWSLTDRDEQYFPYSVTAREMSGCTAACLMLRREAFDAAGGFDEELAVALNDVDLCLKVRQAGYKILFNPYAKLFHYESKSRGSEEETKEKQDRFNREISYFQGKWQEEIDRGDPYYNVNQTLHYANYSLELAEDNRGRYHC